MLETPKIIGLKNMMRMSITVVSFFSGENPGAMILIKKGAAMIKITETIIKNVKKVVKRIDR